MPSQIRSWLGLPRLGSVAPSSNISIRQMPAFGRDIAFKATASLASRQICIISMVLLTACGKNEEKEAATNLLTVQVVQAEVAPWPRTVVVPATVGAVDRANLASRAGGWATSVTVDAGAQVAKDALLAEIGVATATGQIAEAQSRLRSAQAALKEAAANEQRSSVLLRNHTTTAQQYDAVHRRFIAAQAEVAATTSALTVANNNLGYAEIRAPFGGVIAEKNIWPGAFAAPGQTLFILVSDEREIRAHVGPETFAALKVGEPAEAIVNGTAIPATITAIVGPADPETRTHLVKLRFDGSATAPYGAFAEVRLTLKRSPALVAPLAALTRRAGLLGVFVVDKGKHAHFRLVRAGESRDGQVEIAAGLAPGELIVVSPQFELTNDRLVEPLSTLFPSAKGEAPRG